MIDRATFLVAGLALALGASFFAGWWSNGLRLANRHQDEQLRLLEAGRKALAKHDAESKVILEDYREKLAAAANRKPRRVYLCPGTELPAATRGTAGAGAAEPNRRADGTDLGSHDYGPELRAARDALIKCNALIQSVQP